MLVTCRYYADLDRKILVPGYKFTTQIGMIFLILTLFSQFTPHSPQSNSPKNCFSISPLQFKNPNLFWFYSEKSQKRRKFTKMSHFGKDGPPDITDTYSLLVLNITFRTTADDLFPLFDKYGKVVDVFIPRDRRTGDSRGFAFVRYKYADEAQKAVERLDGRMVDGREIAVQFAKYGPNAEKIQKGKIVEPVTKIKNPTRRHRDDYGRDRDNRRSRSRSLDRYNRDRYRGSGRDRDHRRRSRSHSYSPDNHRGRGRGRDKDERSYRGRVVESASPRQSPSPRRSVTPRRSASPRSPRSRSRSPEKRNNDD